MIRQGQLSPIFIGGQVGVTSPVHQPNLLILPQCLHLPLQHIFHSLDYCLYFTCVNRLIISGFVNFLKCFFFFLMFTCENNITFHLMHKTAIDIEVSVTFDMEFKDAFNDKSSAEYKSLENKISTEVSTLSK